MMRKDYLPRMERCHGWRDRCQLIVLALASIYDGLVTVVSLGHLTTDVRAWLLFDVFEGD